jgi:hypothetical protein
MLFHLDNHHLSLQDIYFISPVSHAYNNHEMLSSIPIHIFLANLSPTYFQIPHFIFKSVPHRNHIHKYENFPSHSSLAQQVLVFLMGLLLLPYPRPFFLQLHIHISKPVVSSHAHCMFKTVHTNSQIITKKKETHASF